VGFFCSSTNQRSYENQGLEVPLLISQIIYFEKSHATTPTNKLPTPPLIRRGAFFIPLRGGVSAGRGGIFFVSVLIKSKDSAPCPLTTIYLTPPPNIRAFVANLRENRKENSKFQAPNFKFQVSSTKN